MVRIAILNLTDLPPEIGGGENVGRMIRAWLAPAMPEAALDVIEVATGAAVPDAQDFDGFVLSGSEKGVYDAPPWMAPLRRMLRDARGRETPMFGICFGHQIMADTFGGKAELRDLGEVVGARRFEIEGTCVDVHVWHQDQVTKVPPGATVLGGAPYCPVGVLAYEFPALSVQFHPEYSARFLSGAVRDSEGGAQTPAMTKKALDSIASANVPVDLMAREAAGLLRGSKKLIHLKAGGKERY